MTPGEGSLAPHPTPSSFLDPLSAEGWSRAVGSEGNNSEKVTQETYKGH